MDDLYRYRYRLLASVDVIGSTAFKGRNTENQPAWVQVFREFFSDFPAKLRAEYGNASQQFAKAKYLPVAQLEIWKFVGDEILFCVDIQRHEEVSVHCLVLLTALKAYSHEVRAKPANVGLDLKATIWGAGFPVTNVEVTTPTRESSVTVRDFLGPSVDLGFRLAELADTRKVPVSADVAWLILKSATNEHLINKIKVFFEGTQVFKGINAGLPYPVVWIDREDGIRTAEDRLLHRPLIFNPNDLALYLEEFYAKNTPRIRKPFIISDPSDEVSAIPEDIERHRLKLIATDPDLSYSESSGQRSGNKKVNPDISREVVQAFSKAAGTPKKPDRRKSRSKS